MPMLTRSRGGWTSSCQLLERWAHGWAYWESTRELVHHQCPAFPPIPRRCWVKKTRVLSRSDHVKVTSHSSWLYSHTPSWHGIGLGKWEGLDVGCIIGFSWICGTPIVLSNKCIAILSSTFHHLFDIDSYAQSIMLISFHFHMDYSPFRDAQISWARVIWS